MLSPAGERRDARENEGMKLSPLAQFFLCLELFGFSLWWAINGASFLYWPLYIFTAFVAFGGTLFAFIGALFGRIAPAGAFGGYILAYALILYATFS